MPELDPAAVVRVLNHHRVEFVIIGGIAAQLNDLPVPATIGIDVTPSRQSANLARLAGAFDELDAGLYRAEGAGTWFPRLPFDNWSHYDNLHLMTRYGSVDIVFAPDGATNGYSDLAPAAITLDLGGQRVRVIAPATWEALKQASGRAKDLEHLDRDYAAKERRERS